MILPLIGVAVTMAMQPVTLASPGLASPNVEKQAVTYYSDHFAQQLAVAGIRVYTESEISTLLGFERQKALLGCTEDTYVYWSNRGSGQIFKKAKPP